MTSIIVFGPSAHTTLFFPASKGNLSSGQPPAFHAMEAVGGAAFTSLLIKRAVRRAKVSTRHNLDSTKARNIAWYGPAGKSLDRLTQSHPAARASIIPPKASVQYPSTHDPKAADLHVWIIRKSYNPGKLQHNLPDKLDACPLILSTDVLPRPDGFVCGDSNEPDGELWQPLRKKWSSVRLSQGKNILVTSAEAFREAGFRIREEGSLSATVEDIYQTIYNATKQGREFNLWSLISGFSRIFVRLRGDGLLDLTRGQEEDKKWGAELYATIEPNTDEWTRFPDSHFGINSITVAAIVEWAAKKENKKDFRPLLRRIWTVVKYGINMPAAGETIEQWMATVWTQTRGVKGTKERPVATIERISVDVDQVLQRNRWSILEACLGKGAPEPADQRAEFLRIQTLTYARHLARNGFPTGIHSEQKQPSKKIPRIKHFQLGKLSTVDRSEVESLCGLQRLITAYPGQLAANFGKKDEQPLCLAVFGAPGSGKSFGVEEIADVAADAKSGDGGLRISKEKLVFNVSQFTRLDDLVAALHKVREERLKGKIPVVIFDEFDSTFEHQDFGWLKYFLMPMQDGKFRDRDAVYLTGGCVMVFAGGINHQYAEFAGRQRDREFSAAKGPDFLSRLRAVHDVPSLNRDDSVLPRWQIRRAGLLNNFLYRKRTTIRDDRLLDALLEIERFHHGARSLEAIVQMSTKNSVGEIDLTSLPRRSQLDLHLDSNRLWNLILKSKEAK